MSVEDSANIGIYDKVREPARLRPKPSRTGPNTPGGQSPGKPKAEGAIELDDLEQGKPSCADEDPSPRGSKC